MPVGMGGANRAAEAAQRQARQRRRGMPEFWVRSNELAVVRSLATGAADDLHFGMCQVHEEPYVPGQPGTDWEPCPTAIQNEEGECRCKGPHARGWKPKWKACTFLWVYGVWRTAQPKPRDDGQSVVLPAVTLSPGLQLFLNGGRPDEHGGQRFWQEYNRAMVWFRGPDFNDAFLDDYYRKLTYSSAQQNLTGHDIVIARRQTRDGKTKWLYEFDDPAVNHSAGSWPDAQVPRTEQVAAEQRRYFEALPSVMEYFAQTMKWPLFEEERDERQVPPMPQQTAGYVQPVPNAAPVVTYPEAQPNVVPFPGVASGDAQPAPMEQNAPAPTVVTPSNPTPPPSEPSGIREFLD